MVFLRLLEMLRVAPQNADRVCRMIHHHCVFSDAFEAALGSYSASPSLHHNHRSQKTQQAQQKSTKQYKIPMPPQQQSLIDMI